MIALPHRLKPITTLLAVLGVALVLPLTANIQQAAAKQMDHMSGDMHTACASYCSRLNTVTNQPPALSEDEVQAPQPVPKVQEPYYVQFLVTALLKAKLSDQSFGKSVSRPPDIITLDSNYRL